MTVIDGWSAFVAEYNDYAGNAIWEAVTRVLADGPEVGLFTVIAADRAMAVTNSISSLVRQRWAMRLADKNDYTKFGIRSAAVPEMAPGRALVAGTGQLVQIARPADGVAAAAARIAAAHGASQRPPVRVEPLATEVRLADLGAVAALDTRPWHVPLGLGGGTRRPAGLVAYQGEHALVAGPARSGKSTTLLAVAAACRAAAPRPHRGGRGGAAVAGGRATRSSTSRCAPRRSASGSAPRSTAATGRVLVLVDDAEAIDDVGNVLDRLSTSDRPDLLFVAAGRNDGIRSGYSHWTRPCAGRRSACCSSPTSTSTATSSAVSLPRRAPVAMAAGRGYVAAGGEAELVQVALPRDRADRRSSKPNRPRLVREQRLISEGSRSTTERIAGATTLPRCHHAGSSRYRRRLRASRRRRAVRSGRSSRTSAFDTTNHSKEQRMSQGVVKSTPDAITAIDNMKKTINGGLLDSITTFVTYGDSLNPENFAGSSADQFYAEWPETKTALQNAVERLGMMSDDIMTVNTNIQTAGGNG